MKFVLIAIIVGCVFDGLIKTNVFSPVYNQIPGPCTVYNMKGAEDIILLPNNQAIISSGLVFWNIEEKYDSPNGSIYMLDMNNVLNGPVKLLMDDDYIKQNPDFNPHGISYWENDKGVIFLYVICHWRKSDSIEVFRYNPDTLSLKYSHRIQHEQLQLLNNIIVINEDDFFATNVKYFENSILHTIEQFLRLSITKTLHYSKGKVTVAASGLAGANGINISKNKKYIYVANSLKTEVIVYKRNEDNSLTIVKSITLYYPIDNISVDKETGDLWVALFIKPLEVLSNLKDPKHVNVSSLIVHITVDEESENPFENSKIEQVFQSNGLEYSVGAISTALYHNNTLLLGSVSNDLVVCQVNHLLY